MGWLTFAAGLLRDAMSSDDVKEQPPPVALPSSDIESLVGIVNQYRADTEKNFETIAKVLRAQNEQYQRTIQIQRRWNYGLTVALVIVAIVAIAGYFRG